MIWRTVRGFVAHASLNNVDGIDRHGGDISPITGFFLYVSSSEVRD